MIGKSEIISRMLQNLYIYIYGFECQKHHKFSLDQIWGSTLTVKKK